MRIVAKFPPFIVGDLRYIFHPSHEHNMKHHGIYLY